MIEAKRSYIMLDVRPVSDLRNKFPEIEKAVQSNGHVVLTKNGYGTMVVVSIEEYSRLVNSIEMLLNETDRLAEKDSRRLTHEEVFGEFEKKK